MEGDQFSQEGPLLTGPDQHVVLYLLCDGAQNKLFITFPGTKVSCQACSSPSVPHNGDIVPLSLSARGRKSKLQPRLTAEQYLINCFKYFLRSPCKIIWTPSLSVWNSCKSFNSKAPGRAHSSRE